MLQADVCCDLPLYLFRYLNLQYFPTLFQHTFEYEYGYTVSGAAVRYQFDESQFPNFSQRGYAKFSALQPEVRNEVNIFRSSVYRIVIRFVNPSHENIVAKIVIQSDNPSESDQHTEVLFKPTLEPQFVTVSGPKGEIPSPIVLDPGRYTISVQTDKYIFLVSTIGSIHPLCSDRSFKCIWSIDF